MSGVASRVLGVVNIGVVLGVVDIGVKAVVVSAVTEVRVVSVVFRVVGSAVKGVEVVLVVI